MLIDWLIEIEVSDLRDHCRTLYGCVTIRLKLGPDSQNILRRFYDSF